MSVSAPQRFTKRSPCPICGGGDDLPRGTGRRCSGFLSADGTYAHCTREEHAGQLEPTDAEPRTFAHRLEGECHCGREHAPAPLNGRVEPQQIAATFDYVDETGELLYQALRYEPKGFRQRRPDGSGGWIWNLADTRRVLYRLPIVLGAIKLGATIYVAEGEKDVHAIEAAGEAATCNPMGAGKWRHEFSQALAGAKAARVIADRDDEGRSTPGQSPRACAKSGSRTSRSSRPQSGRTPPTTSQPAGPSTSSCRSPTLESRSRPSRIGSRSTRPESSRSSCYPRQPIRSSARVLRLAMATLLGGLTGHGKTTMIACCPARRLRRRVCRPPCARRSEGARLRPRAAPRHDPARHAPRPD